MQEYTDGIIMYSPSDTFLDDWEERFITLEKLITRVGSLDEIRNIIPSIDTDLVNFVEAIEFPYIYILADYKMIRAEILSWDLRKKRIYFNGIETIEVDNNEKETIMKMYPIILE